MALFRRNLVRDSFDLLLGAKVEIKIDMFFAFVTPVTGQNSSYICSRTARHILQSYRLRWPTVQSCLDSVNRFEISILNLRELLERQAMEVVGQASDPDFLIQEIFLTLQTGFYNAITQATFERVIRRRQYPETLVPDRPVEGELFSLGIH
jgi:hypothetical protein